MRNDPSNIWAGHSFRALASRYDTNEGTTGGTDFAYGFSFQAAGSVPQQQIWELHQRENIYSLGGHVSLAPHAILLRDGRLEYRMMTGAGIWDGRAWSSTASYNDRIVLRPNVQADTWYDVIVRIHTSEGNDGRVEVFVRAAGEQWPTTPAWSKTGPTLPFIPGGQDPRVPTKRSTLDTVGGQSGLYLQTGLYAGSSRWNERTQQVTLYQDNLRRYRDVASAKSGFPQ
ncbi:Polysaccharide lyase [Blastococcus fimeti]|nr:Polysaccharide lyase [Blastococcus fimeti]